MNGRICIALNGKGIDFYDPRSAAAEFLEIKELRYPKPDFYTCLNIDFIIIFFREESGL